MKTFLVIISVLVVLTGIVLGISMSSPEVDTTGRFVLGGNLGLQIIIIIVIVFTLVSVGTRLLAEY